MRKTVLVLLTVLLVASACASNDGDGELDVDVDTPPLQLVHVDEGPTPTTTFTDPVVGPGGPQERNDTALPPVTSRGPSDHARYTKFLTARDQRRIVVDSTINDLGSE